MMLTNVLGSTGILISRVGLGTVKWGRNEGVKYPAAFELPTDHQIQTLLNCTKELGINFLDTAPAYGQSEERLGKLLLHDRKNWVICTKVGEEFEQGKSYFDFTEKNIQKSIERSLKKLKTDYLDIVLVHSNGNDENLIEKEKVFNTLEKMKQNGFIRAIGMSTKTIAGGKLTIDQADVVMVTYNPLAQEEKAVIDYAYQKNKGVLIKKALVSGHINLLEGSDPVETAMQFVFKPSGVSSVILGTLNPAHLRHNVKCAITAMK